MNVSNKAKPFRIAFLTPEFVTELPDRGGLATYLSRMVVALNNAGYEPEIITLGKKRNICEYEGARVETVPPDSKIYLKALRKAVRVCTRLSLSRTEKSLQGAIALGKALERRHAEAGFDIVQSSNYGIAGYYVEKKTDRIHVVRCSSSRNLWHSFNEESLSPDIKLLDYLERRMMRRADRCYSPSRFLAQFYRDNYGYDIGVVRPPLIMSARSAASTHGLNIPSKYFVHFGRLGYLKGTDVVIKSFSLARRQCPDISCVFAGIMKNPIVMNQLLNTLSPLERAQMYFTGPIPRPQLYALVRDAVASILPSRADNIPNTVLESLMLDTPVIGSNGASIDELVEPGVSGELVPIGDAQTLSSVMIDAWKGYAQWIGSAFRKPAIFDEFEPERAVSEWLKFVFSEIEPHRIRKPDKIY